MAKGKPLSAAHKKAISDALKGKRKGLNANFRSWQKRQKAAGKSTSSRDYANQLNAAGRAAKARGRGRGVAAVKAGVSPRRVVKKVVPRKAVGRKVATTQGPHGVRRRGMW